MPNLYRIALSGPLKPLENKEEFGLEPSAVAQLKKILSSEKSLLRYSLDVTSQDKSISLLLADEKEDADQKSRFLQVIEQAGIVGKLLEENPEIVSDKPYKKPTQHHHDDCGECHEDSHEHHDHDHGHHGHEDCEEHHEHHSHEDCEEHHEHHAHDSHHALVAEDHHHSEHLLPQHPHSKLKARKKIHVHKHHPNHLKKGLFGTLWGAGLFTLALLNLNLPLAASYLITGLSGATTLYLGKEAYVQAAKSVKAKKLSMNVLYTLSTLTIAAISALSYCVPGLPLMCEAAPLILGLWHVGEAIEHSLLDKIESHLDARDCAPEKVTWIDSEGSEKTDFLVKDLIPNDIIIIQRGEVIPVDGECLEDDISVLTQRINGDPDSTVLNMGDTITAGMQLTGNKASMRMRVKRTFQRSYLAKVAENIAEASRNKKDADQAPIEKLTNKILKYFIPGLLITAIASGIIIGCLFNPALAIQCAISVTVSACPCALRLITPLAIKIGMKKAADHGINFKNGRSLQAAADIDTVVFDLNGTLTKGKREVTEYKIYAKNTSELEFFHTIALLQQYSTNSIAKVILDFIGTKGLPTLSQTQIRNVDLSKRNQIKATINNDEYIIGNEEILRGLQIQDPRPGAIYLVKNREIIGRLVLEDSLRNDVKQTIMALKNQGKEIRICTGTDARTANYYAQLLGITHVRANCTAATDKTNYIEDLQRSGRKVAMIGDAINDAAAVAKSDFGIAITSSIGDKLTQEQAGAVIQNETLMPVATAFEVAKQTKRNIWQNLMISLTYNSSITLVAAGLFVALGFALNPALGIALMVVETALVLANAYRFKKQSLQHKTVPEPSRNPAPDFAESTHRRVARLPSPRVSPSLEKNSQPMRHSPGLNLFHKAAEPPVAEETPTLLPAQLCLG